MKSADSLNERVRELLVKTMGLAGKALPSELDVDSISTWDSLSHMELIEEIERQFQITIAHADSVKMLSESLIVNTLRKYL